MTRPSRIIFLDIDGVLVTYQSMRNRAANESPEERAKTFDPASVSALNEITDRTGAGIVISSTWRIAGVMFCRELLRAAGVKAPVIDVTPRLLNHKGDICLAQPRGREIQAWISEHSGWYELQSFVILDDDSDMEHLKSRLVLCNMENGLTAARAARAIEMLRQETSR
jgi:hypothetical protein